MSLLGRAGRIAIRRDFPGNADIQMLLPDLVEAKGAYESWLAGARQVSWVREDNEVLSKDSENRRRSRLPVLGLFSGMGPTSRLTISLYFRLLPDRVKGVWLEVLRECGVMGIESDTGVAEVLKGLSLLAKKYQSMLFSQDWKYYVDLHLLRDYVPLADINDFSGDIEDWVSPKAEHTLPEGWGNFYELFSLGVRRFLRRGPRLLADYRPLSIDEFSSDPGYWARTGTSDGRRLKVISAAGNLRWARKSKWASSLAMSSVEVANLIKYPTIQVNHAIQKRELGKVRAIVAGDLGLYLKMSYVSHWLEAALDRHPNTSLFFGSDQMLTLFRSMVQRAADTRIIKEPLDQEEFDHHIDKEMLNRTLDEIRMYIGEFCNTSDRHEVLLVMGNIIEAMRSGVVHVGHRTFVWLNGILSGWRWTALLDTCCNAGEVEVARDTVFGITGVDPILDDYTCQGDDDDIHCVSYGAAVAFWEVYILAGFKVNAGKFFISDDTDEFLRQVAWNGSISGYPARGVPSLMWRNPVGVPPAPGAIRVREMASSWNLVFNRMGKRSDALMVKDIARANRLEGGTVVAILGTPAAFGGVGLFTDYEGTWAQVTPTVLQPNWRFQSVPTIAIELGKEWSIRPDDLARYWATNVEVESGTEVKSEPEVRGIGRCEPAKAGAMPVYHALVPLHTRFRPEIPPSACAVLVQIAIENREWGKIRGMVEVGTEGIFDDMFRRTSRRVFIDWVLARLPFSVPVLAGWSDLAVSATYNVFAKGMWSWCCQRHRVSLRLVKSAAYRAEIATRQHLEAQEIRISG